jgi:hypothetical protein
MLDTIRQVIVARFPVSGFRSPATSYIAIPFKHHSLGDEIPRRLETGNWERYLDSPQSLQYPIHLRISKPVYPFLLIELEENVVEACVSFRQYLLQGLLRALVALSFDFGSAHFFKSWETRRE